MQSVPMSMEIERDREIVDLRSAKASAEVSGQTSVSSSATEKASWTAAVSSEAMTGQM